MTAAVAVCACVTMWLVAGRLPLGAVLAVLLAAFAAVLLLGVFAARGSRASWVRLRIIAPIVVLAVVVIVAIPGFLPDWVRVEQAVCGALVLPVAILANLPRAGAAFRRDA